MKVAIIIINYNNYAEIKDCLNSLDKINKDNYEVSIIIVDNHSRDKSIDYIQKKYSEIKIIVNSVNKGFAEANNIGLSYALKKNNDFMVLLNPDTIVDKNLLINLIKPFQKDYELGIISPKIYFAPGYEYYKNRYKPSEQGKVIWYAGGIMDWHNILPSHRGVDEIDQGQYNQINNTDFATGCCLAMKAEVIKRVGFFDKKYFLYWEDTDFCIRAQKAGFKIIYNPYGFLWHKNASASGGAGGYLSVYYQTRNRLLFTYKFASLKVKMAVFREAIKFLIKGSKWQKKAVQDFFSKFRKIKY